MPSRLARKIIRARVGENMKQVMTQLNSPPARFLGHGCWIDQAEIEKFQSTPRHPLAGGVPFGTVCPLRPDLVPQSYVFPPPYP